ncbi:amidase [Rhodovibrionaceae bacterium A322]
MASLCDQTAVDLRAAIGKGEVSPVELLDACLERIDQVNPTLNAVVSLDEPAARKAAEEAEAAVRRGDELGALHGLPVGVKDLNETKGFLTTYGSPLHADFVPDFDCRPVANMRAAGGIITAKTNTPEFGAGANTNNAVFGFTGNPFDPNKTCAGSSGGSAVALATGMLPVCNGSDLGGSLRTPAAFSGVVGLRPTPGVVVDDTRGLLFNPLSVEGPMGRTAADTALLLSALVSEDRRDPLNQLIDAAPLRHLQPADLSSLKVAFSEDLGFAPIDNSLRDIFKQRVGSFASSFAQSDWRNPYMGDDAHKTFEVLRSVGFLAGHLDKYRNHRDKVGDNVAANVELGLTYDAEDVAWASSQHSQIFSQFIDFMDEVDLLITPTASATPFGKELTYPADINGKPLETYIQWVAIAYGVTLTGHPALSIPCGLDHNGMPFGLQLVGRRHGEAALLAAGMALEAELAKLPGCGRPLPDLAKLSS